MNKIPKSAIIIILVITLVIAGGSYMFRIFFGAFAPPKISVTRMGVKTNRHFVNGVTISKIAVDSMGPQGYPVAYTRQYAASCNINHPIDRSPEPPHEIRFHKPGNYSWSEDTVQRRYVLRGLSVVPVDSTSNTWRLSEFGKHPICPLQFQQQQWYFLTFGDPRVLGVFFYIDNTGNEHQHLLLSGVSPI